MTCQYSVMSNVTNITVVLTQMATTSAIKASVSSGFKNAYIVQCCFMPIPMQYFIVSFKTILK